jgi:hypothetical protein
MAEGKCQLYILWSTVDTKQCHVYLRDSMEIEYQTYNRKITVIFCLAVSWIQCTKCDIFSLFLFTWDSTY